MIQVSCTLFSKAEKQSKNYCDIDQILRKQRVRKMPCRFFLALLQNDTEHRSQLYPVDTKTPFGQHSYYTVIDCIISELGIHLFMVIIGVGIYMHSRLQIHVQAVGL